MLVVNAGATLFLCGLWITLQFRWVQISHPGVALASEKLLFALAPSVCGPMLTWVASASFGAASAPFYASAAVRGVIPRVLASDAVVVSRASRRQLYRRRGDLRDPRIGVGVGRARD